MKTKDGSIINVIPDVSKRSLSIVVNNGLEGIAKRTIGTLTLDLTKVSKSNLDYAAFHGFKQRIADKAALGQFNTKGIKVTPEMKLEAMTKLVDYYNSGAEAWSPNRVTERVGSDELMLARALDELDNMKPEHERMGSEAVRALVAGWTKQQRTAVMTTNAKVKPIIDRMTLEQVKDIDTDELLAGF